ncbi:MAG: hypothetical protein NTW14_07215 [bacterium]|nr:hypothetical protein [bacterium]
MTKAEVLLEIKKLPTSDRLQVIVDALDLLREEIGLMSPKSSKQAMSKAAKTLLQDYQTESELTAFTTLDCEPFHA